MTVKWYAMATHCYVINKFKKAEPHHHNHFTALFSGTARVSWCQKRTSGLYGAREV